MIFSLKNKVAAVTSGASRIGKVDILVNNAGIAHIGTAENTNKLDVEKVLNVNVKGVHYCVRAVLPAMKANGGGVILNMASVASSVGISDRFAYSMSKGAVKSMTQSMAKDFLNDNICCNFTGSGSHAFCGWLYHQKLCRKRNRNF